MGICQTAAQLWPASDRAVACAVCTAESGGDPNAHATRGEDSRGIFQINVAPGAHPQLAGLDLFDPTVNAQAALQIWQASGWQPWTTYTGGKYRQFLDQCGGIGASDGASNTPASSAFQLTPRGFLFAGVAALALVAVIGG